MLFPFLDELAAAYDALDLNTYSSLVERIVEHLLTAEVAELSSQLISEERPAALLTFSLQRLHALPP